MTTYRFSVFAALAAGVVLAARIVVRKRAAKLVGIAVFLIVVPQLSAQGRIDNRAVGLAVDAVEAEYQQKNAIADEAVEEYDEKISDLRRRVASGEISASHAEQLNALYRLDVFTVKLDELGVFLQVSDVRAASDRETEVLFRQGLEELRSEVIPELEQTVEWLNDLVTNQYGPAAVIVGEFAALGGDLPLGDYGATTAQTAQALEKATRALADSERVAEQHERELHRIASDQQGRQISRVLARANQRIITAQVQGLRTVALGGAGLLEAPDFTEIPAQDFSFGFADSREPQMSTDLRSLRELIQP